MMLPTHAFAGMALGLLFALAMPEVGSVAIVAGLLGGVMPDFDMYVGHRKTLHYPVFYSALGVTAVPVVVLIPTPVTVAVACFLLGAALHSVSDIFGGGLELRPWEATSDRGVYDHHRNRWIAPRRWVRYDGAPEDLLLCLVLAVPLLVTLGGLLGWVVLSSLAVAVVYTAVRRTLPLVAESLVGRLPALRLPKRAVANVPSRYLDAEDERSTAVPADD